MTRSGVLSKFLAILLLAFLSGPCFARDESGSRFDANGVSIYYEVSGSGSGVPLVVANGGPGFDSNTLYFTAGPNDESAGLFGSLTANVRKHDDLDNAD